MLLIGHILEYGCGWTDIFFSVLYVDVIILNKLKNDQLKINVASNYY